MDKVNQAIFKRIGLTSLTESKQLKISLLSMHLWAAQYSFISQSEFSLQDSLFSKVQSENILVHIPFIHSSFSSQILGASSHVVSQQNLILVCLSVQASQKFEQSWYYLVLGLNPHTGFGINLILLHSSICSLLHLCFFNLKSSGRQISFLAWCFLFTQLPLKHRYPLWHLMLRQLLSSQMHLP